MLTCTLRANRVYACRSSTEKVRSLDSRVGDRRQRVNIHDIDHCRPLGILSV